MTHTMPPQEIESQCSGARLLDTNGDPLQAGARYMINKPGQWAKFVDLFEDELTCDLCFRIDIPGSGPVVQRVDDLAEDVVFFLQNKPGPDVRPGRHVAKERIKELIDALRDAWADSSTGELIDEISVLVDQL